MSLVRYVVTSRVDMINRDSACSIRFDGMEENDEEQLCGKKGEVLREELDM